MVSLKQTNFIFVHFYPKFRFRALLSFCLFFCWFQTGVAYKKCAFKFSRKDHRFYTVKGILLSITAVSIFKTNNFAELRVLPAIDVSCNTLVTLNFNSCLTKNCLRFLFGCFFFARKSTFYLKIYGTNETMKTKNINIAKNYFNFLWFMPAFWTAIFHKKFTLRHIKLTIYIWQDKFISR